MKKNTKKVSIIVPVYKSEMFLKKCIDSILMQTYENIELILVDDGSPDNSGQICEEYLKADKRVIVIHKKNGGTCEARNVGLEHVSGEYVMFVDGDDWLCNDCVEYLLNLIEKNNADMSMTDSIFTTRNFKQNSYDWERKLTPEEATCEILYVKTPVGPWNKLYSTDIIRKNNLTFSVPWFGEGLWFSVMAAQYSNTIAYGHRKVYVYRKNNPNSGTTVRNVQHGINSLKNIEFIKEKLIVRTDKTRAAADWHIWKNNFNLLVFIIGAKAKNEFQLEYRNALKNVRGMVKKVLLNSEVNVKGKIEIIGLSLFPRSAAKCAIFLKTYMFNKDKKRGIE